MKREANESNRIEPSITPLFFSSNFDRTAHGFSLQPYETMLSTRTVRYTLPHSAKETHARKHSPNTEWMDGCAVQTNAAKELAGLSAPAGTQSTMQYGTALVEWR